MHDSKALQEHKACLVQTGDPEQQPGIVNTPRHRSCCPGGVMCGFPDIAMVSRSVSSLKISSIKLLFVLYSLKIVYSAQGEQNSSLQEPTGQIIAQISNTSN